MYYDPRLLSDFGGPLFNLHQAKLVQRNIADVESKLVAPWHEYDKLRTGSVVLMRISLRTYTPTDSYPRKNVTLSCLTKRTEVLMPESYTKFTPTGLKSCCHHTNRSMNAPFVVSSKLLRAATMKKRTIATTN